MRPSQSKWQHDPPRLHLRGHSLGTLKELRALFWGGKDKKFSYGNLADWRPQVLPPECASAIPRFVVLDAAFPGPVATPVRATQVSGSAPRALAA